MHLTRVIPSLLLLFVLTACTKGPDTDELKNALNKELKEPWTVDSFTLTNSSKMDTATQQSVYKYNFSAVVKPHTPLYRKIYTIDDVNVLKKQRAANEPQTIQGTTTVQVKEGESTASFEFSNSFYRREGKPSAYWPGEFVELDSTAYKQLLQSAKKNQPVLEAKIKALNKKVESARDQYLQSKKEFIKQESALFAKANDIFQSIKDEANAFNIRVESEVDSYIKEIQPGYEQKISALSNEREAMKKQESESHDATHSDALAEISKRLNKIKRERRKKITSYRKKVYDRHQVERDNIYKPYDEANQVLEQHKQFSSDELKKARDLITAMRTELKNLVNNQKNIQQALKRSEKMSPLPQTVQGSTTPALQKE